MENLLRDLTAHALKSRRIALIESGSWALSAGKGMREILSSLKDTEFISDDLSFKSSLRAEGEELINKLADKICESI
jgi:flavorubredoxin